MSKIPCHKCGRPFLTEKTYQHLSMIAHQKGLTNIEKFVSESYPAICQVFRERKLIEGVLSELKKA